MNILIDFFLMLMILFHFRLTLKLKGVLLITLARMHSFWCTLLINVCSLFSHTE